MKLNNWERRSCALASERKYTGTLRARNFGDRSEFAENRALRPSLPITYIKLCHSDTDWWRAKLPRGYLAPWTFLPVLRNNPPLRTRARAHLSLLSSQFPVLSHSLSLIHVRIFTYSIHLHIYLVPLTHSEAPGRPARLLCHLLSPVRARVQCFMPQSYNSRFPFHLGRERASPSLSLFAAAVESFMYCGRGREGRIDSLKACVLCMCAFVCEPQQVREREREREQSTLFLSLFSPLTRFASSLRL